MTLETIKTILIKNIDAMVNIADADSVYSTEYYEACAQYISIEGSDIPAKLKELKAIETECGTYLINSFAKHLMSSFGLQ